MSSEQILAIVVVVLGSSGTYLLLPHKHGQSKPRNAHIVGAVLGGLALLLFALLLSPPSPLFKSIEGLVTGGFFYAFALGSVGCAIMTVTSSNPVHSALWFAAVVLSTCGLFLQAGAQFLAAGTVIVYAGAIIVTFLFVIMLAQMEGRALYDRAARMPFRATLTCFMLLLGVLWSLLHIETQTAPFATGVGGAVVASETRLPRAEGLPAWVKGGTEKSAATVLARAIRPTARLGDSEGRPKPHVAGLGETLYTDNLLVVELTGALLFVALIGALAIAAPKPQARPVNTNGPAATKVNLLAPKTANV